MPEPMNNVRVVPPPAQSYTVYQLTRQNMKMRETLIQAAEQFRSYSEDHMAKDTPEIEKSNANREWYERCLSATKMEV